MDCINYKEIQEDFESFYANENKLTLETTPFYYAQFATSYCHLFGTLQDQFIVEKSAEIFMFYNGNRLPYVWLDLDEGSKFGVKLVGQNLKLQCYLKIRLNNRKLLITPDKIMACSVGDFICLSGPQMLHFPIQDELFCLLITCKYEFKYVFLKDQPCVVALHELM